MQMQMAANLLYYRKGEEFFFSNFLFVGFFFRASAPELTVIRTGKKH